MEKHISHENSDKTSVLFFLNFFFNANHPLQGFRSHCSVRGYSSLLVATAGAEATTRTGRQHTHAHTEVTIVKDETTICTCISA